MKIICNVCGYLNGHAPGCPEREREKPVNICENCGGDIYAGDTIYSLDTKAGLKYFCCNCCYGPIEAEVPEAPDYNDYLEQKYERERHDD